MSTFYNNYVEMCAKCGKSLSAVAESIGLSRTAPNGWKKGKMPNDTTLAKLSNYFGITVDELKNGIKKEPSTISEELDKNDAVWETYDGLLESTKDLPLHEANLIIEMLGDGGQGMNFNELYAFTSVLSKLSPEQRLRLFQLADKLQQDKSVP